MTNRQPSISIKVSVMLKDNYGRLVTNLRISITQSCNLACPFCHREGDIRRLRTEMTPQQIMRIVSVAASLGVDRIKLTGGEPLLREDIQEIVELIHSVRGITDIGITTNGILLEKYAEPLKVAGLNRVNVSLGTLDRETYVKMTGIDALDNVLRGVFEAVRVRLRPVKLNMVVLKGVNDDQVWEMLDFSKKNKSILQLIEVESETSDEEYYKLFHRDFSGIEEILYNKAEKIEVRDMQHRRKFFLKDDGVVEVVRPMHNTEFCAHCTRLRLTSDGKLKPCLFRSDNLVDILTPIRKDVSDEELQRLFTQAVTLRIPYFM
jgi:cyclic pyranopterin phosphate synthase